MSDLEQARQIAELSESVAKLQVMANWNSLVSLAVPVCVWMASVQEQVKQTQEKFSSDGGNLADKAVAALDSRISRLEQMSADSR